MNATSPRPDTLFKPGNRMGAIPRGQKGSRQKLAAMVFADVAAYWDEQGPGFMRRLAFHDMAAFASFVAKIMPQRIEHEVTTPTDDIDEALLAISVRVSRAIAYLPADDREMLGMLLDKAELLASQKKLNAEGSEEGVGGQSSENLFGGKGTPLPQSSSSAISPDHHPAVAAGATREIGFSAEAAQIEDDEEEAAAAAGRRDANVIDADFEE